VARPSSTLGNGEQEVATDHLVLVADRVPEDGLAMDLLSRPVGLKEAGVRGLDRIGDCLAPGLIAHAVYSGHALARSY